MDMILILTNGEKEKINRIMNSSDQSKVKTFMKELIDSTMSEGNYDNKGNIIQITK